MAVTTRREFAEMVADNFSEEDCMRVFGVSRDSLEDFSVTWNEALEYQYNIYILNEEADREAEEARRKAEDEQSNNENNSEYNS